MTSAAFDPTIWWLEQLPGNLKPDDNKVEELERLRSRAICCILPLPNDIFAQIILSSSWATLRAQENVYMIAKEKMPDASEKDRLEAVFRSRAFPQNPAGIRLPEDEINRALKNIDSLDDLVQYFAEKEKEEPRFRRDILGSGKRILKKVDEILEK